VQQSAEVIGAKKADESPKEQRTEEPRDRPTKRTLVKERRSLLKQEGNDQGKITTQNGHEEPWRVELIKEPSEGRRARNQANQGTRRC
jgi:hypothetical protein